MQELPKMPLFSNLEIRNFAITFVVPPTLQALKTVPVLCIVSAKKCVGQESSLRGSPLIAISESQRRILSKVAKREMSHPSCCRHNHRHRQRCDLVVFAIAIAPIAIVFSIVGRRACKREGGK
ncbi:hypothetical protein TIFTF001_008197 [Ficus carica]|uniref:Uncharacterized protein n=1 Tax=Ficus carica TaxID=3494 RepID=A0AA88CXS4_FICCA|nr:hypothetical protein TIFTF001_008197 [Ficus carica]